MTIPHPNLVGASSCAASVATNFNRSSNATTQSATSTLDLITANAEDASTTRTPGRSVIRYGFVVVFNFTFASGSRDVKRATWQAPGCLTRLHQCRALGNLLRLLTQGPQTTTT